MQPNRTKLSRHYGHHCLLLSVILKGYVNQYE